MTDKRSKYDTDPLDAEFARRALERRARGEAQATGEIGGATRDVLRTPAEVGRGDEAADAPTRLFDVAPETGSAVSDPRGQPTREFDPGQPYPSVFAAEKTNAPGAATRFAPEPERRANGSGVAGEFRTQDESGLDTSAPPRVGETRREPFRPRETSALGGQTPEGAPTSRVVPGVGLPENMLLAAPYAPLFIGAIAAVVELLLVGRGERRVRYHAAQGLALHASIFAIAMLLRLVRGLAGVAFGGMASGLVWLVWAAFFVVSTIFLVRTMLRVWNGEPEHVEALSEVTRLFDEQIKPRA